MNLYVFGTILLLAVNASFAQDNYEDDRLNEKQFDMVQERMEERPSSTTIGGSRGGQLEEERYEDDLKEDYGREENELLEYNGLYRRGL